MSKERRQENVKPLNIEKIIKQAVLEAVNASAILGYEKGKAAAKTPFQQTEARLYAFPELKKNIEKYKRDIEDLHVEGPGSGKSKDIAFFSAIGGNTRLTAEEIQEGRIMALQKRIYRDQAEIDEIEYALETVKGDEYYFVIEQKYFAGKSDDEIAAKIPCDPRTVRRNKSRLVRRLAVKLYGAEALP